MVTARERPGRDWPQVPPGRQHPGGRCSQNTISRGGTVLSGALCGREGPHHLKARGGLVAALRTQEAYSDHRMA